MGGEKFNVLLLRKLKIIRRLIYSSELFFLYVENARKGPNLAFEVLGIYYIEIIQERKCLYSFENYSVVFMIFNIQS